MDWIQGDGITNPDTRRRPGGKHEHVDERLGRGFSRPPLARMLRLHEWLMANRHPNCRKIAEEFEISAKTVQRDINFMRDRMGLPIEYDKKRFGFHYTRTVTVFPTLGITVGKSPRSPGRRSPPPAMGERPALSAASRRSPGGSGGLMVRIRFDSESAREARGRTWHATQVIRTLPNGSVEMTLQARDEWEIARWILSWGGHAWVAEPPRLRKRVREMAREILARH